MDYTRLFDEIRYEDLGKSDFIKLLQQETNNYDLELLEALLYDLEFYFFVEKNEMECNISDKDIEEKFKEYGEKKLKIPTYDTPMNKGLLDKEKLFFPYEFSTLYQFNNLIIKKINEIKSKQTSKQIEKIQNIDLSDTKGTEKIIILEKLGILNYLRMKEPFNNSVNALANVLSAITGEKQTTIQSYINPILQVECDQKNNPLNKLKTVEKVKQKLLSTGYKLF